jgi:hypothetical protein
VRRKQKFECDFVRYDVRDYWHEHKRWIGS